MWANYSTDQKYFTGHMFNITLKLEKKSHKMSFKALTVKIQWLKNQQGGKMCPPNRRAHKNRSIEVIAFKYF